MTCEREFDRYVLTASALRTHNDLSVPTLQTLREITLCSERKATGKKYNFNKSKDRGITVTSTDEEETIHTSILGNDCHGWAFTSVI